MTRPANKLGCRRRKSAKVRNRGGRIALAIGYMVEAVLALFLVTVVRGRRE
jgi:hypothetical protein